MHSHFVSRFPSFVLNKNQYLPAEAPFWCCIEYVNIFIYERYKNNKQRFVCPINQAAQSMRNFYNFLIVMSEGRARRSSIVIKTSLIMIDVFQLSNSPNYSHEYRHIDPLISISTAIEKRFRREIFQNRIQSMRKIPIKIYFSIYNHPIDKTLSTTISIIMKNTREVIFKNLSKSKISTNLA